MRRASLACLFVESASGWWTLRASPAGLVSVDWPLESEQAALDALGAPAPPMGECAGSEELERAAEQLREYLEGRRGSFDLRLDLTGLGPFTRAVLLACREIPAGECRTYGELAQAVGRPRAARAVGQAMARNPLPLVIPCHRVVGSQGRLTGFGGGLCRKAELLGREGVVVQSGRAIWRLNGPG